MNKSSCASQCGSDKPESIQQALSIIGDKWTALILRMLHEEPLRFTDVRDRIPSINPRTLTQRMAMLEDNNIVHKKHFEDPSQCTKYVLSEKGQDLDAVIHSMALWGEKYSRS